MRILWLSRWFPYPADNGAKIRAFNLIQHLSTQNSIDLFSFTSEDPDPGSLAVLQKICHRVEYTRYAAFHPRSIKSRFAFFSFTPRSIVDTHSAELQARVETACRENPYDVVIAREFEMVHYAVNLPVPIKIFEEIELSQFLEQFQAETKPLRKFRKGLTWWKMSRYHRYLLDHFSGATVVSEREQEIVTKHISTKTPIEIISNGVDVDHYAGDFGDPQPGTLIYTGALTYNANYDAVSFFLVDIFPLIIREIPQIQLRITGKHNDVDLTLLPLDEHVILTGYLSDIRPTLKQSSVCIIPLRKGGGTRLKILEALAAGVPVVSTQKGMEGLNLTPGHDILIADGPQDFAHSVIELLTHPDLCQELRKNGLDTVNRLYNWSAIAARFNEFIVGFAADTT
jgi:polysaccharide biosynthesis protein PslH